ncbi:MAG: sulfatase-like hydrolase/transferase [Lachnospiraceae bacterium]|nr:sulfatase-like hydrolase/transferase [Lachnospiraceae bacterium]
MYAIYIPYLMDYYIIRPQESFFSFLDTNILNGTYHFEGIVIGITIVILYCFTLHAGVSTLILSLILFILTHASYTKYLNRRELLRLDDLRLTEAAGMAAHYIRFELSGYLVLLLGVFVFFTAAGFLIERFGKIERKKSFLFGVRLLAGALLCVVLIFYTNNFLKSRYVIDVTGPLIPETNMYVLYRFLQNDSLSAISIENVRESYDFLLSQEEPKETEEESVYPNVIVIMNESWWNTDNIASDSISFSKDPMSAFKELSDRCVTGYLTTNVYGGGTVSPEMEFLTGLNTKYYLADSAYAQTLGRRLPSLADYFNGLDYRTVAIHPYYGRFYSREAVYEAMEFDKVVFEEDMLYKDIYTRYISDESLVKQIIAETENNSGEPEFIWAVSMANHLRVLDYDGAEAVEDYEYPVTLDLKGKQLSKEDYDTLVNYVNGIYLANQAFLQLTEYFSETEEPTLILMFGDHCPYFSQKHWSCLELMRQTTVWKR